MKEQKIKEFNKKIDTLYPAIFLVETHYGYGFLKRGKQEQKEIRRLSLEEEAILESILGIFSEVFDKKD